MNKVEYIDQLVKYLKPYQIEDKYSIIANYEQIIDEILLDFDNDFNEVILKLGSPKELATEIKLEFGYSDELKDETVENKKQEEKHENTKFSSGNQYERKRQKSNGIWYAFSFVVVIVQFALFMALVFQTYLLLTFGLNAKVEFASQRYNGLSDNTHIIRICSDQKCYGLNINESYYRDVSHIEFITCDDHRHCNLQMMGMNNHIVIQVGWIGFLTISINGLLILVIHIFIYRNIKKIIKSNDEYNRLRNY